MTDSDRLRILQEAVSVSLGPYQGTLDAPVCPKCNGPMLAHYWRCEVWEALYTRDPERFYAHARRVG